MVIFLAPVQTRAVQAETISSQWWIRGLLQALAHTASCGTHPPIMERKIHCLPPLPADSLNSSSFLFSTVSQNSSDGQDSANAVLNNFCSVMLQKNKYINKQRKESAVWKQWVCTGCKLSYDRWVLRRSCDLPSKPGKMQRYDSSSRLLQQVCCVAPHCTRRQWLAHSYSHNKLRQTNTSSSSFSASPSVSSACDLTPSFPTRLPPGPLPLRSLSPSESSSPPCLHSESLLFPSLRDHPH